MVNREGFPKPGGEPKITSVSTSSSSSLPSSSTVAFWEFWAQCLFFASLGVTIIFVFGAVVDLLEMLRPK